MKYIKYIEFASGWRPPAYRCVNIEPIRPVNLKISKNGNQYTVYLGKITDEDAVYLSLMDQHIEIMDSE